MSRTLKRVMLWDWLAIGRRTGCQKGAETKKKRNRIKLCFKENHGGV